MEALEEEPEQSLENVNLGIDDDIPMQVSTEDAFNNDRARPSKHLSTGPFSTLKARTYVMATAILLFCMTAQWYWEAQASHLQNEAKRCETETEECFDPDPDKARRGTVLIIAGVQFLIPALIICLIAATKNGDSFKGLMALVVTGIGSFLMIVGYFTYLSGLSLHYDGIKWKYAAAFYEICIVIGTALCMACDNFKINMLDDPKRRALGMNAISIVGIQIAVCYAVAGNNVSDNGQYGTHDWSVHEPQAESDTVAVGWFMVSIVSGVRIFMICTGYGGRMCELLLSALLSIGAVVTAAGYWMICEWYPNDKEAERIGAVGMSFFLLIIIFANVIDLLYTKIDEEFVSV